MIPSAGRRGRSRVYNHTMKPPEQMETERLVLRTPRLDDAPAIFTAYAQDPEVTCYLTWRPDQHLQQVEEFISGCISAWEKETRFPFVITLTGKDEPFGMMDIHITGCTVGFGYVIARFQQRKGYATEATRAIIEWAFRQPSIYRVNASTDVENFASQRVMEKAGMTREGFLRKYAVHPNISDVPRDCYVYAIVK